MDPITHGLLGAATSQSLFLKKTSSKIWLIGLLAAMSPDLDIFIRSSNNPFLFLIYHRNFTHSLFFIPIGGLIIGGLFCLIFPKLRQRWPCVLGAAFLAYATHGVLDDFTSYGTLFYWPFSNSRIAWDTIAIIDPIFTIILLFGVAFTCISKKSTYAILSIILALLYLLFGVEQHHRALTTQTRLISSRQQTNIFKQRVMPAAFNLSVWRSVYVWNGKIYLDTIYTPLNKSSYVDEKTTFPLFTIDKLPNYIRNNQVWNNDIEVFSWFSDNLLGIYSTNPFIIADLRYTSLENPYIPYWCIRLPLPYSKYRHIPFWRLLL